jgi:hypothetical protein
MDIVVLKDGTLVMPSDEGRNWPRVKMVPVDPANPEQSDPGGYLSCLQTPDGTIHLLSSRRYYRFNLAWLETSQQ